MGNTQPLTAAELDRLPEGSRVRVLWADSLEPRLYELHRDGFGAPRAHVPGIKGPGVPLERIGTGARDNRVWRA
jgi:hypothetical protein